MAEPGDKRLFAPLGAGPLKLNALADLHRAPLRDCVEADADIWTLYPINWRGPDFDRRFDEALAAADRDLYAVLLDDTLVGMTGWLNAAPARQSVEVGNSYLHPAVRGTGVNGRIKRLMLGHAFACGVRRVEFRVTPATLGRWPRSPSWAQWRRAGSAPNGSPGRGTRAPPSCCRSWPTSGLRREQVHQL